MYFISSPAAKFKVPDTNSKSWFGTAFKPADI